MQEATTTQDVTTNIFGWDYTQTKLFNQDGSS
jgi:hypothetical protein